MFFAEIRCIRYTFSTTHYIPTRYSCQPDVIFINLKPLASFSKEEETERKSGNTCWLHRNLYVIFKFMAQSKILWENSEKKTCLALERINYLELILMLFWIKQRLISFILQRNRNGNESFDIKDSFTERFQQETSVLHQSMCITKPGLLS